ncbi:MAG: tolB protein precursor [Ignavibacteriae bacterium]|nr:MAG: tolB protein precursor [Ignavibacteriota bacterium]
MKYIKIILFLTLLFVTNSVSQENIFGKNKVQYKKFNTYFIQSSHFDVYFFDDGYSIAEFTADAAEEAYQSISKSFRYQITSRIPIIVYNSHNDFQQTNVIYEYLEEGIGGVTELFKNRIVIPFEGDYKKFRHVIHHELVHAVINDMFYGGSLQSVIANNIMLQLPLWFNEGLAEYEALKWDVNSDMFIRDAVIHENLPTIDYLDGYFAYRGGQAIWNWIANKYGEQKIAEILSRIKGTRSVEQGFKSTIGLGLKELNEKWQKEMRVQYWPDIAKREDPTEFARQLTNHQKDGSFYNTSPTISPQGDRIAFISNRDDYFDVFIMDAIDGKIEKKLVKGQRTADFEELHLLTPGMAWSPDGKQLALSAKSKGQDAIILIDVATGKQKKLKINLDGISSIDWSPDGNKLTFVGHNFKQSDIYIYDINLDKFENITNDIYTDSDPVWSVDGKFIYFISDRHNFTPDKPAYKHNTNRIKDFDKDLFRIELETKNITNILTLPESDETSPIVVDSGLVLFISDLNGINNIYSLDLVTKIYTPLTNSLSGIYQISITKDKNKLTFASLVKGGFDIFLLRTPLERKISTENLEPTEFIKQKSRKFQIVELQKETDTLKVREDILISTNVEDTIELYGKDIKVDFKNYVFTPALPESNLIKSIDTSTTFAISNNLDEEGNYIINKYKLDFSPDIIYGTAGFNTYYGVLGSTIMAFSDMMGDHQIFFLTNLNGDLKNSDYILAYYNLPHRIDYMFQAFHSARFIILGDAYYDFLYRFRTYGASAAASYPLTKFNRFDLGLNYFVITKEKLDIPFEPIQRRNLLLTSLSYVHDNSLWGYISPANGTRYNLTAYGTPKISSNGLSFISLLVDYRTYFKIWKNYTLAQRFAFGGSYGNDPQRFIVGGVDNWINRKFTNNRIPFENAEDFLFLTSGVPLRGYIYNTKIGTKYFLLNTEFRFPLLGYLSAGPLPVFWQTLTGVLFLDLGSAWHSKKDFQAFAKNENGTYMKDLLGGTGYGIRFIFLGFLVKLDVAWWFDLQATSRPKYYISLGTDF